MTESPQVPSTPVDRLDSWKEIAAYMRRDVKTVQRWEKREGMPVHRHLHDKMGSVYAFRTELDGWAQNRRLTMPAEDLSTPADAAQSPPAVGQPLDGESEGGDSLQDARPAARVDRETRGARVLARR